MTEEQFEELRETARQAVLAAYDLPTELTNAWKASHAESAGPVRPDEEPTR